MRRGNGFLGICTRPWRLRLLLAVTLLSCSLTPGARAQDLDDLLGGFDDEADANEITPPNTGTPPDPPDDPFWDLTGDASLGASYNYREHRSTTGTAYGNLSRLRAQLDLQLDLRLPQGIKGRVSGYGFYDFAYVGHGRSRYTRDVLDDYEYDFDFREVYLQGSPNHQLDVKIGRQIVNWGRSDSLRVVDVINPLDNREPGLVDIEDLRRPVGMLRLDYYPKALPEWSLQLLLIPEFRRDLNPAFGSDFNPIDLPPGFKRPDLDLVPDGPSHWGAVPEFGAAITGTFSGWDLSLYGARVYENMRFVLGGLKTDSHVTMVGGGGNLTFGSWLVKSEVAYLHGIEYLVVRSIFEPTASKSRLDAMAGVEYYGFVDTQIALEVVNRHIFDFEAGMKSTRSEDELESALRITTDLMNARLHLTALGFVLGERAQDGSVVRIEANYDLRDSLVVGGGIVLYQEGDNIGFRRIGANDRFFARIEYSF